MALKDAADFEKHFLTRAVRGANRMYCTMYHRLTVHSPCQLPRAGPAILVCNHTSGIDPFLIQAVSPRLIVWMMASEYYEHRATKWFFKKIGAIPVERAGKDLSATRAALRALADGRILGIFPEGKIETSRNLLQFQTGASMMALRTGVMLYPACIDGSQRSLEMLRAFLTPQDAHIAFGAPLRLQQVGPMRDAVGLATSHVQNSVDALLQGLYAARFSKDDKKLPS